MRWKRLILVSLVLFCDQVRLCFGAITNFNTIDQCPAEQSTAKWDNRATALCSDNKQYHCLEDESTGNRFHEFCSPDVKMDKGYYPTFNNNTKTIVPKDCPPGQYQPIKDKPSHLFNKCENKRLCDDTGQMFCEESDATQDRLCMCKYMDGFVRNDYYGDNPNKTEICCPVGNLCKCSIPDTPCTNGFELNAASQCVPECQEGYYRPQKTLECVKMTNMATMSNQSSPSSSTSPNNKALGDGQSSNNTYLYIGLGVTGGVIVVFVIIFAIVAVRKGWCKSKKKKKVDIRNGRNGQPSNKTYIHVYKPQNVQIGEKATANFVGNGNNSMSEGSDGNSSPGSDFKGFPIQSQQHENVSANSLPPGAMPTTYEKSPNPTPTSTMERKTYKETYDINFKALIKAASDKGLIVQDVPGDGNCMYNSALLQLKPDHPKLTVDEMRKHVQKFIESNPSTPSDVPYRSLLSALEWKPGPKSKQHEEYRKLQQNKNLEESQREELLFQIYLNEVRENEWGDPFTLHALSQIYNVEIEVLSSRNLTTFTRTSVVDNPKMTIRLGHLAVNGQDLHYVALLPDDDVDLDHHDHVAAISNLKQSSNHKNNNGAGIVGKHDSDHNGADINDIELEDLTGHTRVQLKDGEMPHPVQQKDKELPTFQVELEDNLSEEIEVKEPLLSK